MLLPAGGDQNLFQKRQHRVVVLSERGLRVIRNRRQRRQRALLDHLVPPLQHLHELGHERIEVPRHVLGRAPLGEVHHRRARVRLHAVRLVLHGAEKRRQNRRVRLLLDLRAEIRAELPDGVHSGPAHARVRVRGGRAERGRDRAADILQHALRTPLGDLRERDERGVAFAPVGIRQQRGNRRRRAGEHGVGAERDGDAVQALLTHLVALALARVAVLLLLARVPLRVVLNVQQERAEAVEQPRDKVGQLAHHARRAVARLRQGHQELARQVARAVFQVVVRRDGHHGIHDVREVFAHEPRVASGELDEKAERLLRVRLVAALKRAAQRREHRGEQVLELGAIGGVLQALHEAAARAQRRELNRARLVRQALG